MKTYPRIYLLIFLMLSAGFSFAQSEDELFHDAGYSYYEKDYPNAHTKVSDGLVKYPDSKKLKALKDLICEKWTCTTSGNLPPCSDRDEDGICDDVDECPDDPGNNCLSPPPPTAEEEEEEKDDDDSDDDTETVSGCTDPEANNYNGNATESCSNCCRYTINTQFKRVPGKNKMTWNPRLAEKATSIRITYTIKPYDEDVALPEEILVSEVVTGQSSHIYDPQNAEADQIETDVRIYITIDSKTTVVGSKFKRDEIFQG